MLPQVALLEKSREISISLVWHFTDEKTFFTEIQSSKLKWNSHGILSNAFLFVFLALARRSKEFHTLYNLPYKKIRNLWYALQTGGRNFVGGFNFIKINAIKHLKDRNVSKDFSGFLWGICFMVWLMEFVLEME